MGWSTLVTGTVGSITTGSTVYTSDVLDPGEAVHVQLSSDTSGTTDNLEVYILTSCDGTTWDDVDHAYMSYLIPYVNDPDVKSVVISGVYQFRIYAKRSGTTDTFSVTYKIRYDGVNAG